MRLSVLGLGVLFFILGLVLSNKALGMTIVILGAGTLTIGVLLPAVIEADIGPQGIRIKPFIDRRDREFASYLTTGIHGYLERFAEQLCGQKEQATALADDALLALSEQWDRVQSDDRRLFLLCTIVALAGGRSLLDAVSVLADGPSASPTSVLLKMPFERRAIALLSHYSRVGEEDVARMLRRTVEDVRAELTSFDSAVWEEVRVVAEPGGAVGLAALTSGAYRPHRGERVAVVICGANTDIDL